MGIPIDQAFQRLASTYDVGLAGHAQAAKDGEVNNSRTYYKFRFDGILPMKISQEPSLKLLERRSVNRQGIRGQILRLGWCTYIYVYIYIFIFISKFIFIFKSIFIFIYIVHTYVCVFAIYIYIYIHM